MKKISKTKLLQQPCLINIEDSAGAGGFVNPALHPVQEPSSETKGYQTQGQAKTDSAAAGPGSFREDSYNTSVAVADRLQISSLFKFNLQISNQFAN